MDLARIGSTQLSAAISPRGAELVALETAEGAPLLWNGDPAWWTGRSPLLFPIVGRVPGDEILVEGRRHPMKQHGFARTSDFTLVAADAESCSFELTADAQTRSVYPFDFALVAQYRISGRTLAVRIDVSNQETRRPMPFSFGFHPAFCWPLRRGGTRDGHVLNFSHAESAPIARPEDGLLGALRTPNPVGSDRKLALHDALFDGGALIFDRLASDTIEYQDADGSSVRISFAGLPHLGIWTKPGAPFVCIEPWHGYAAPLGFAGDLADKPGIIMLAAGASHSFDMQILIDI